MRLSRSKELFRLARFRRFASSTPESRWSVKSPKDLYDHLSQYIIGQERAKRILSVAVFNHYHRITPRLPPSPPPNATSGTTYTNNNGPRIDQLFSQFTQHHSDPSGSGNGSGGSGSSSSVPPAESPGLPRRPPKLGTAGSGGSVIEGLESLEGYDPSRAGAALDDGVRRDITRLVGTDGHGDPSLTHAHEVLSSRSREGQWARDGYFSSSSPPTLLNTRRRRSTASSSSAAAAGTDAGSSKGKTRISSSGDLDDIRARKEDLEAGLNDPRTSADDVVIEKSNVLMVGPTGTGKTLMARTLAKILDVPFASCDATSYTQAGYVGEDVENCVLRLLQAAEYDVARTEIGIIHIDEVDKLARRGGGDFGTWGGGRDVGGEGVQQALLRLLEGTTLTLNAKPPAISSSPPSNNSSSGSPSGTGSGSGTGPRAEKGGDRIEKESLRDAIDPPGWDPNNPMNRGFAAGKKGVREGLPGFGGGGGGSSGKGETFVVDTTNILFVLSGAFVGLESIVSWRLGKGSIGFGAPLPLPPVTSSTTAEISPTPLKGLSTPDLQTYGLIPEFLGRLPILSTLHPLSIEDLVRILIEPKNALIKQYQAMFERYGSELRFTRTAIEAVAKEGLDRGGGARGLRGVLEEVLVDAMFEVPGSSVRYCLITAPVVQRREAALYFSRGQRMAFLNAIEEEDGPKRATPAGENAEVQEDAAEEVEDERIAARG